MPTKRFSTMSMRPMACLPPSLFSACNTPSGESFPPFRANLIVPLPCRAVCDCVCVLGARDLDHSLRNEWTCNAGAEQILVLVNRACLKHRKDKISREFFTHILDDAFRRTGIQSFRLQ